MRLLGPGGEPYESAEPGTLGGHRGTEIYGRLDCRSALAALARRGPYADHRVFFATEADAISAGYRPCAVCMPAEYREWKERHLRSARSGPLNSAERNPRDPIAGSGGD